MNSIKQPNFIIFGKNSIDEFNFPANCLVITSKGAKSRGWLDRFKSKKRDSSSIRWKDAHKLFFYLKFFHTNQTIMYFFVLVNIILNSNLDTFYP